MTYDLIPYVEKVAPEQTKIVWLSAHTMLQLSRPIPAGRQHRAVLQKALEGLCHDVLVMVPPNPPSANVERYLQGLASPPDRGVIL
jgi:hypothetical protein